MCNRLVFVSAHWSRELCCLQGRDAGAAAALAAYVSEEALHRKNKILSTASWPVLYPADIPMQTDDHSCGVYAMVFAECLAAGYPLQQCGISSATAVHARARLLHFLQASAVPRALAPTSL